MEDQKAQLRRLTEDRTALETQQAELREQLERAAELARKQTEVGDLLEGKRDELAAELEKVSAERTQLEEEAVR